jgi:fumarate hydratase class II
MKTSGFSFLNWSTSLHSTFSVNDYTVSLAGTHGQLRLNAYELIEGLAIIESQSLLFRGSIAFRFWAMKKRRNWQPRSTKPTREFSNHLRTEASYGAANR